MDINRFELISRVNFTDIKYYESGNCASKALVGIKTKDEYKSVEVTLFGEEAERFAENIQKGDYVHLVGRIVPNEYTNKDGKTVKTIQLIANDFDKVVYSVEEKKYVLAEVTEEKPEAKKEVKEEAKKETKATKPWEE